MSKCKLSIIIKIDTSAFEEDMRKMAELVKSGALSPASIEEVIKRLNVSSGSAPYSTGMMNTSMGQRIYDLACKAQKRIEKERILSCIVEDSGRHFWYNHPLL